MASVVTGCTVKSFEQSLVCELPGIKKVLSCLTLSLGIAMQSKSKQTRCLSASLSSVCLFPVFNLHALCNLVMCPAFCSSFVLFFTFLVFQEALSTPRPGGDNKYSLLAYAGILMNSFPCMLSICTVPS